MDAPHALHEASKQLDDLVAQRTTKKMSDVELKARLDEIKRILDIAKAGIQIPPPIGILDKMILNKNDPSA